MADRTDEFVVSPERNSRPFRLAVGLTVSEGDKNVDERAFKGLAGYLGEWVSARARRGEGRLIVFARVAEVRFAAAAHENYAPARSTMFVVEGDFAWYASSARDAAVKADLTDLAKALLGQPDVPVGPAVVTYKGSTWTVQRPRE